MVFVVTSNNKQFERHLNNVALRELPFATAVALTKTAKAIQSAEQRAMKRQLDRPKPFTLKSMRIIPAKKSSLSATILFKDTATAGGAPAGRYLRPQVLGGSRRLKRFEKALIGMGAMRTNEFAVPGRRARLNSFGNVSNALIKNVLTSIRSKGGQFFVPSDRSTLPRGVYQRMARKKLKLIFVFVTDDPDYRKRYDFVGVARKTAMKAFPGIHRAEFTKAIANSRFL